MSTQQEEKTWRENQDEKEKKLSEEAIAIKVKAHAEVLKQVRETFVDSPEEGISYQITSAPHENTTLKRVMVIVQALYLGERTTDIVEFIIQRKRDGYFRRPDGSKVEIERHFSGWGGNIRRRQAYIVKPDGTFSAKIVKGAHEFLEREALATMHARIQKDKVEETETRMEELLNNEENITQNEYSWSITGWSTTSRDYTFCARVTAPDYVDVSIPQLGKVRVHVEDVVGAVNILGKARNQLERLERKHET